jgi:hypothetical protein
VGSGEEVLATRRAARLLRSGDEHRAPRAARGFGEALEAAQRGLPEEPGQRAARLSFKRERLAELRRLSKLGETLLTALVAGKTVDPTPLLKMYGGS